MKKRLFNYFIINLLLITVTTVSVSYPKHAYGIDANLSAKNIINKYIEGYLSNEFKDIATNDLELLRWAYKSIEDIPKSFREEELNKAINKVVHDLKDLEQTKKSYGSILDYSKFIPVFSEKRNFVYGKRFYKILYPEMKYEIMEIREESDTESLFGDDRVSEMAFVRIFYSNPKNAPYLEYHQYKDMSKVKSVIIKLYLWVSNEKEYLISHYVPTEYKRELFNRHNSKAIREREDREKLMKEQQQKVEKAQKEEQEKVEKEARKKQKVEYERKLAERKKREKKAEAQRNIEAEKRKQEEARIAALRKESEVPAKALFKFKCEIDSIGFLGYYSTMEITDTNITLFNNFRNRTKTIWFGNFDTIEKQYHRAAFGGAWQLRINRVYSIIIKDEAEIDKIYNVLTLAISQWYDKFSDVAPRKTRPVFLSKSSKVTGQYGSSYGKCFSGHR